MRLRLADLAAMPEAQCDKLLAELTRRAQHFTGPPPYNSVEALRYAAKWHLSAEKMGDQGELAQAVNDAADWLEFVVAQMPGEPTDANHPPPGYELAVAEAIPGVRPARPYWRKL